MTTHEYSALRARLLGFEGEALEEAHGWLIGVACAVERKRGANPKEADSLIAELRASEPPVAQLK